MKVEIEKSYPMPCPVGIAWEFLQNIEAVAGCMPGAKIVERLADGRYKGTVTVKVGPATMSFRGEVEVQDIDGAARSLRLIGKGTDSTGSSGASMNLSARVEAAGEFSTLVGASEVSMSGKAAAFGGRMMSTVADQILKQFADNFAAQVRAIQAQRVAAAAVPVAAAAATATAGSARTVPSVASAAPPAVPLPVVASELNGLALVWAVIKDWLRSLFGKGAA